MTSSKDGSEQAGPMSPGDVLRIGICCLVALVLPVSGLYSAPVILWAGILLTFVLLIASFVDRAFLPHWSWPLTVLFAVLVLWGAAGLLWSIDPRLTVKKLGDFLIILPSLLLMFGASRRLSEKGYFAVAAALTIGIVSCLGVLVFERVSDGWLADLLRDVESDNIEYLFSTYNRGLALLVLLVWPAALALRHVGRRRLAIALPLAALVVVSSFFGDSFSLAMGFGLATFLATRFIRWNWPVVIACLLAATVVTAPVVTAIGTRLVTPAEMARATDNLSIPHRAAIWQFAADMALDRPWSGYGLATSRAVPGGDTIVEFRMRAGNLREGGLLPLHPHNASLQWWLELGLPGAVIGAFMIAMLVLGIGYVRGATARSVLMAQAVTAFTIANLSFGIWQVWWLAAIAVSVFFTLAFVREDDGQKPLSIR